MNIEPKTIERTQETSSVSGSKSVQKENDGKFAEELKNVRQTSATKEEQEVKSSDLKNKKEEKELSETEKQVNKLSNENDIDKALNNLKFAVKEINQSDENNQFNIKNPLKPTDNNDIGDNLINNDFNIQDKTDILPQMTPNMNFGGDGQPFSSLMNNNKDEHSKDILPSSAKDLAEESAILSTMAENIAMANKASIQESSEKVVNKNEGIKKVDTQTGITNEIIVKYDTVIMNEADVEVFTNLVQNGEVSLNDMAPEAAKQSVQVSKTLADMLAKAMQDNKPVRIDFDNDISVIIKISRDGKITADFLPSSQVAEAYLKENLPLLKQRFDEQNIKYDELNQRERRNKEQDNNRKRGRENE